MTRIVAGTARGRRLAVPASGTRPTSDRVREALFSALDSMLRQHDLAWSQVHVIDGYAGSGALGLEALSRGAAGVVLVERDRRASAVLRANVEVVGLPGAQVIVAPMAEVAARTPAQPEAAMLLLDPPYAVSAATIAAEIASLTTHGWLTPQAVAVVERPHSDAQEPFPDGWEVTSQRRYGDTVLWYGRRSHLAEGGEPDA